MGDSKIGLPPRRITIRDFVKRTADFLDEIEFDRRSFVITRHGRPATLLLPVAEESRRIRTKRGSVTQDLSSVPVEPVPDVELTAEQEAMLMRLSDVQYDRVDDIVGSRIAIGLEISGLATLMPYGFTLTPAGKRLAEAIRDGERPSARQGSDA